LTGDADLVEPVLGLLAIQFRLAEVAEHEMHVGPAGEHRHAVAGAEQLLGHRLGAGDRAALALAELLGLRDAERDRLAGDDVHERAALLAGEHRGVDLLAVLLAAEDQPRRARRRGSCGRWW
jgi:hypothetical protein